MGKEELFIPLEKDDFMTADIRKNIETEVDKYNAMQGTESHDKMNIEVFTIANISRGLYMPNEFARAMGILLFARVGREATRMPWRAISYDAFESGDLEICRELVIRSIKESSKSDVANGNKAFIPLSQESADDNVADIMGMITDELGELPDEDYEELLDDFGALLVQWRALEVPKCQDKDAYELVYELVQRCYEHKAYRTATRLSGLLYVADERKKKPNLAKTNLLMGKIMYELGYMEVAKRCFMFADEDTKGKCWKDVPEKYRILLEQETKLEITEEVLEKQKFIDDGIASGKFKGYTLKECRKYRAGELEIEFPDTKKQEKERNKIVEKALKAYEKHSDGDASEKLKGIDEAFKVFTEEPEAYEQAAYLYFMKANIYLDEDDLENAYDCIKKAYKCKNGNINGMVLLTFAIILSKMGRFNEANIYIFRTFILFGEEFIADKLGEGALEAIEDYL